MRLSTQRRIGAMGDHWQPGDTVVVRWALYKRMTRTYAALNGDPTNIGAWPHIVLEDSAVRTALYLPEGTQLWRWNIEEGRLREPRLSHGDSILLLYPGRP